MTRRPLRRLSARRLALVLGLLFTALAVPTAVLLFQARQQIKFEAFHQYRTLADELGLRIDAELQGLIATEEARSDADYRFVVLTGDPATSKFVQRSPLSRVPIQAELPGVIGYFQIAADGQFSTPALPDDVDDPGRWGLDAADLSRRTALRDRLLDVLRRNQLLERRSSRAMAASSGDLPELKDSLASNDSDKSDRHTAKKQESAAPAAGKVAATDRVAESVPSIDTDKLTKQSLDDKTTSKSSDAESGKPPIASQAAFDKLNSIEITGSRIRRGDLGKVDELQITHNYQNEALPENQQRQAPVYEQKLKSNLQLRNTRKEQTALLEVPARELVAQDKTAPTRVQIFESALDPFEFSLLEDGNGVLFRKVWRDGQRTIQGLIIDQKAFVSGAIVRPFEETALAQTTDMVVAYRHDVVQVTRASSDSGGYQSLPSRASQVQGELLHQLRLSAPLGDFQLLWNIRQLPTGPGGRIVIWAGAVLLLVLISGFVALYRLGLRQILLARQQQDFVSAVSHELNTPLTSIRMYAEILRAGWSSDEKKSEYYAFIHDESERLSRLIANVLQLARLERNDLRLELKPVRMTQLLDLLRSRLASQIERAGFECRYLIDTASQAQEVSVDIDAVLQIVINLVDNALKFSARAAPRRIEIATRLRGEKSVQISVRDYGPGVETSQLRKIFTLFYRSGNELKRETTGTGIGLALVRQLARAMHGEVDVLQREPGAEFVLILPTAPRIATSVVPVAPA